MAGRTNQYSANTSLASGTSGAVSSPSTDTLSQSHPTNSLRPGPPPHADSYQDEDMQASSQSEPPSPRQLLRETTPDRPRPSGARLLAPSPFASPVKSFSRATAVKDRMPPKFLGSNDADDHEMQEIREEDENASSSDDSATGRKTKKKPTDGGHVKNKVKVSIFSGLAIGPDLYHPRNLARKMLLKATRRWLAYVPVCLPGISNYYPSL